MQAGHFLMIRLELKIISFHFLTPTNLKTNVKTRKMMNLSYRLSLNVKSYHSSYCLNLNGKELSNCYHSTGWELSLWSDWAGFAKVDLKNSLVHFL
jgi:hypothetical protein